MSSVESFAKQSRQTELSEMQSDFVRKKRELSAENKQQISELKDKLAEKKENIEQENEAAISHLQDRQKEHIKDAYKKTEQVKKSYDTRTAALQKKYEEELADYQDTHGNSPTKGKSSRLEQLRTKQEAQMAELHETGNKKLLSEKIEQEQKLKHLHDDPEKRYSKRKEDWTQKEQHLDETYTSLLSNHMQSFERELKNQKKQFDSSYQHNQKEHVRATEVQNDLNEKEKIDIQRKFLRSIEKYQRREADPFYKIQDRGSQLIDDGDAYILRAYIPEYEKDIIKVAIEKDRATITGQRSFQDKFQEENKTTSTNNYQSFREEFPFDKIVIAEGMTRERSGDYVIYRIPIFKGIKPKKMSLDRKA